MTDGVLRGKTLAEKAFGPGYRPEGFSVSRLGSRGCAVESCADPVSGELMLWVDDLPPLRTDWYLRLLGKLVPRVDTWVRLCSGHLQDVALRDEDYMTTPDLWAPWRESPPVLQSPIRILTPRSLEVAR